MCSFCSRITVPGSKFQDCCLQIINKMKFSRSIGFICYILFINESDDDGNLGHGFLYSKLKLSHENWAKITMHFLLLIVCKLCFKSEIHFMIHIITRSNKTFLPPQIVNGKYFKYVAKILKTPHYRNFWKIRMKNDWIIVENTELAPKS